MSQDGTALARHFQPQTDKQQKCRRTSVVLSESGDVAEPLPRTDVNTAIIQVSDTIVFHHARSTRVLIQHRQRVGTYRYATTDTEQVNTQIPYLPIKQLGRRFHRPLPIVVITKWRTALVIISLFLPNQSQRGSFAVIGHAEAGRRRSPMTCRLQ